MWTAAKLTRKRLTKTYARNLKIHISYVMETLTISFKCCKMLFIHISTWIAGKDSMKCHSLPTKKGILLQPDNRRLWLQSFLHAKRVWQDFGLQNLGQYHKLYVQRDTLLLTDLSQKFGNSYLGIHELHPVQFLSAPELAWQACFKKKTEVEMELTGPKMLLMVEKDIRGEICCAVHRFANAKSKYMKTILQIQIRYTSYTRM